MESGLKDIIEKVWTMTLVSYLMRVVFMRGEKNEQKRGCEY